MATDQGSSAYAQPGQVNAYGPNWVGSGDGTGDIPKAGQTPLGAYMAPGMAQSGTQARPSRPSQPAYPASGGGSEAEIGNGGTMGGVDVSGADAMGVDNSSGIGSVQ